MKYSNVIDFLAGIHCVWRGQVKRDVDFDADLVGRNIGGCHESLLYRQRGKID